MRAGPPVRTPVDRVGSHAPLPHQIAGRSPTAHAQAQAQAHAQHPIRGPFGRLEGDQERRAAAAEAMAKNYALKLDVVKQVRVCMYVYAWWGG